MDFDIWVFDQDRLAPATCLGIVIALSVTIVYSRTHLALYLCALVTQ